MYSISNSTIKLAGATLLVLMTLFSTQAQATSVNVPADQPTIQASIDAAANGDTVLVADGTYTGEGNRDIDFHGKGIIVKSENGPDFTIIDCQGDYITPRRGLHVQQRSGTSTVSIEALYI